MNSVKYIGMDVHKEANRAVHRPASPHKQSPSCGRSPSRGSSLGSDLCCIPPGGGESGSRDTRVRGRVSAD